MPVPSLSRCNRRTRGVGDGVRTRKRTRYAAMCQPHQDLIPVVFDTFGAAGASAVPVLHHVAAAFSKHFGSCEGRLIFLTRLITLIVSKVAAGLERNGYHINGYPSGYNGYP